MNLSRFLSVELKQEAPFAKFDGVMPQRVRVDQRTGRAILNACLHEASSEDRRQIEQLAGTLRHTKYEKASRKHRAAMREQMRQERRRAAKAERLRGRQ